MADNTNYIDSSVWTSPSQDGRRPKTPRTPRTPTGQDRSPEPEDPEIGLRKELEGVRKINEAIEGLIGTLERANSNMNVVSNTVNNSSTLLNTWTRILSQTEHNQRLLLHPAWKGVTEDLAAQEAEAIQRQQEAERRALEEEQRREAIRRRREQEEEKRRLGGGTSLSRGSRGAGVRGTRSRARATASRIGTGTSFTSDTTGTGSSSTRGTSGIGRGFGIARGGRTRGTR